MKPAKLAAIKLTVEAIGVLVLAIIGVAMFEKEIAAVNWRLVSLVCVAALAIFGIYRWQMRQDNDYDVLEMLMKDGKADLYAHITVASFALAVWLVVQQALAKQQITELMLGVLGIFVAGKAAGGFSDALQKRPAPTDQSRDINIGMNAAPAAPAATPANPMPVAVVDQAKPIEVTDAKQKKGKPRGKTH